MLGERFSMPNVIGLAIRVRESDVVTEPLPERSVDLIRYLDEKERSSQRLSNRMLSTSFTHGELTEEVFPSVGDHLAGLDARFNSAIVASRSYASAIASSDFF